MKLFWRLEIRVRLLFRYGNPTKQQTKNVHTIFPKTENAFGGRVGGGLFLVALPNGARLENVATGDGHWKGQAGLVWLCAVSRCLISPALIFIHVLEREMDHDVE